MLRDASTIVGISEFVRCERGFQTLPAQRILENKQLPMHSHHIQVSWKNVAHPLDSQPRPPIAAREPLSNNLPMNGQIIKRRKKIQQLPPQPGGHLAHQERVIPRLGERFWQSQKSRNRTESSTCRVFSCIQKSKKVSDRESLTTTSEQARIQVVVDLLEETEPYVEFIVQGEAPQAQGVQKVLPTTHNSASGGFVSILSLSSSRT
jgi:hypothetical protein